jgi:hypothetical protein
MWVFVCAYCFETKSFTVVSLLTWYLLFDRSLRVYLVEYVSHFLCVFYTIIKDGGTDTDGQFSNWTFPYRWYSTMYLTVCWHGVWSEILECKTTFQRFFNNLFIFMMQDSFNYLSREILKFYQIYLLMCHLTP